MSSMFAIRGSSHGGKMQRFITGQHVSLWRLTKQVTAEDPMKKYLLKKIPPYPTPVEFWVTNVSHVTEETGFKGILKSEEFRPGFREFSWWGFKIKKAEIRSAERRYMERNFPNKVQALDEQKPFLEKFTTSPLFQLKKSRYGNYRFTFPLTELMERYKDQNCGGQEPVLRVYGTITFKQQIVYTVLIHSPEENERFRGYPLLEESEWVRYQDGGMMWKAQAICETHRYQFVSGEVQKLNTHLFYVWDQVNVVFHLPKGTKILKTLKIPRERLIEALEACKLDEIDLSGYRGPKTKKERFMEAKMKVNVLKDYTK